MPRLVKGGRARVELRVGEGDPNQRLAAEIVADAADGRGEPATNFGRGLLQLGDLRLGEGVLDPHDVGGGDRDIARDALDDVADFGRDLSAFGFGDGGAGAEWRLLLDGARRHRLRRLLRLRHVDEVGLLRLVGEHAVIGGLLRGLRLERLVALALREGGVADLLRPGKDGLRLVVRAGLDGDRLLGRESGVRVSAGQALPTGLSQFMSIPPDELKSGRRVDMAPRLAVDKGGDLELPGLARTLGNQPGVVILACDQRTGRVHRLLDFSLQGGGLGLCVRHHLAETVIKRSLRLYRLGTFGPCPCFRMCGMTGCAACATGLCTPGNLAG